MLEDFKKIGISYNLFTLTATQNHKEVVHDFFLKLKEQGDLSIKEEDQFFDEKENMFLPDRYVSGTCPHCGYTNARGDECENCGKTYDATSIINPISSLSGTTPVIRKTEHFFLHLEKYQESLQEYTRDKNHWRTNVLNFTNSWIADGLRPRAITRDVDWGVSVPLEGWENKVIYVWFEAVIGYLSASKEYASLSGDADSWKNWWHDIKSKGFYFIGKDNIPFHTVIWPIELMAYDPSLNLPYDVPANQFLNIEGEKFSTSRGTAVWVSELLEKYSADALRYYVCSIFPETKDANFSKEELKIKNNGELAATWGNLVNRVIGFTVSKFDGLIPERLELSDEDIALHKLRDEAFMSAKKAYEEVRLRDALKDSMALAREVNKYLDKTAPWTLIKTDKQAAGHAINIAIGLIRSINLLLAPIIPDSAEKIHKAFGGETPLFETPEIKDAGGAEDLHKVMYLNHKTSNTDKLECIEATENIKLEKLPPLFAQIE